MIEARPTAARALAAGKELAFKNERRIRNAICV
jgi:hypothetical protein